MLFTHLKVYFWTGSPALPASEDGFQPMPSVTIRPADDAHLPTANTCISRLYIPLYSSRAVLRQKLLLAIKTKNFGFVWSNRNVLVIYLISLFNNLLYIFFLILNIIDNYNYGFFLSNKYYIIITIANKLKKNHYNNRKCILILSDK